ncbi:MAG: NifB/NifX family molybdenum-iron cluster-binding protein [Acetobacteraceae bacterium]|nr:NifB/NifX family molybdenum-iron cluster-binding protein [Acetobacteraceae bacterium]
MRIAISTEGGMVAEHFGHCPEYTLVEVEGGAVRSRVVVPNPGHRPGAVPEYLGRLGMDLVITRGMGRRAQALLEERGIRTVVGVSGRVDEAVAAYLAGTLRDGDNACEGGRGGCGGGRPGLEPGCCDGAGPAGVAAGAPARAPVERGEP